MKTCACKRSGSSTAANPRVPVPPLGVASGCSLSRCISAVIHRARSLLAEGKPRVTEKALGTASVLLAVAGKKAG